jgi:hypothetical protein
MSHSSHRHPPKIILPSSMALWACSHRSQFLLLTYVGQRGWLLGRTRRALTYLSTHPQKATDKVKEPNSPLSVHPALLQSHPYCDPPTPITYNTPLHAFFCQRIPVVVASVTEADYAAPLLAVGKCWSHRSSSRSPNQPWSPPTANSHPLSYS